MTIHTLELASNKDGTDRTVADCLREMAREIDAGNIKAIGGVVIFETESVAVYGIGGRDLIGSLGLVSMGEAYLQALYAANRAG